MTPPALNFPVSREIAGLWRELPTPRPQALWIGHLLLHHVDAAASVRRSAAVDPVLRALLGQLSLSPSLSVVDLDQRLGLGLALVAHALQSAQRRGLVQHAGPHAWELTPAGHVGFQQGCLDEILHGRRSFRFVEGGDGAPPAYLALSGGAGVPLANPGAWRFSPAVLSHCIDQTAEWKEQHGFPTDVCELRQGHTLEEIILDQAEALPVAVTGEAPAFVFVLDGRAWRLAPQPPVRAFASTAQLQAGLPLLLPEPEPSALQAVWLEWARRRGVADREAAACRVSRVGATLQVHGAEAVGRRLQRVALDEDGWLLLGAGLLRRALRIEFVRT